MRRDRDREECKACEEIKDCEAVKNWFWRRVSREEIKDREEIEACKEIKGFLRRDQGSRRDHEDSCEEVVRRDRGLQRDQGL